MSEPKPVAHYLEYLELNVDPETVGQVVRSYTGEQLQIATMPRIYRTALRPPLAKLLETCAADRGQFVYQARISYGYSNAEIGKSLGLKPSIISDIFCKELRRSSPRAPINNLGTSAATRI